MACTYHPVEITGYWIVGGRIVPALLDVQFRGAVRAFDVLFRFRCRSGSAAPVKCNGWSIFSVLSAICVPLEIVRDPLVPVIGRYVTRFCIKAIFCGGRRGLNDCDVSDLRRGGGADPIKSPLFQERTILIRMAWVIASDDTPGFQRLSHIFRAIFGRPCMCIVVQMSREFFLVKHRPVPTG